MIPQEATFKSDYIIYRLTGEICGFHDRWDLASNTRSILYMYDYTS